MGKRIAAMVVLILMVAAPAAPVYGANVTLDTYCASSLNGSWNSTFQRCTIPAGNSGQVLPGDTLAVFAGQSIVVNGTLTVGGTLTLQGGMLANYGMLANNRSLNHQSSGVSDFLNYGTLTNNAALTVYSGATFTNYNLLTNAASLTVDGELTNTFIPSTGPYGSFTNTAAGTLLLSNSSGASDQGTFFASLGTSNTNHGTMTIDDAHSAMYVDGSLTNHGEILNKGTFKAVSLTNSSTGRLYNDTYADWTCGGSSAPGLVNEGVFTNRYILNLIENCTFTNKSGGSFVNYGATYVGKPLATTVSYGSLVNQGAVNNYGSIILPNSPFSEVHNDNNAVITNDDPYSVLELGSGSRVFNAGLIEHKRGVIRPGASGPGRIDNYSKTDFSDYGTLNKYCAGSITLDYDYIEPDPVDLCVGTIVIKKDTVPDGPANFSFSGGLGAFSLDDDADPTLPNERTFSGKAPGSYSVVEAAATGFTLTSINCTSTQAGDTTTHNLSTRTATINLDGEETVTCTFTNTASCSGCGW